MLVFSVSTNRLSGHSSRRVRWRKPKPGFVKINTDGSAIRNPGQAGAGTVIRDHYGNWITGSYGYIPLNYGCCGMALNWHLNKNLVKVEIEIDASAVISLVLNLCTLISCYKLQDSPTQVPAMDIECHGKERKQFSNFVFLG
ncbi:hypothetical protein GOBAR_AA35728 [Gossypium barbadense]|uniref:RNase H type-1 domain-containing protein n=1 Tax=Gossypium barbadense TaxID=3634 RepID=A0A2P5W1Q1_GOSBA|nr:hypothetical protein GOBAR_AA35728 [Gossypium barbadense]